MLKYALFDERLVVQNAQLSRSHANRCGGLVGREIGRKSGLLHGRESGSVSRYFALLADLKHAKLGRECGGSHTNWYVKRIKFMHSGTLLTLSAAFASLYFGCRLFMKLSSVLGLCVGASSLVGWCVFASSSRTVCSHGMSVISTTLRSSTFFRFLLRFLVLVDALLEILGFPFFRARSFCSGNNLYT